MGLVRASDPPLILQASAPANIERLLDGLLALMRMSHCLELLSVNRECTCSNEVQKPGALHDALLQPEDLFKGISAAHADQDDGFAHWDLESAEGFPPGDLGSLQDAVPEGALHMAAALLDGCC